MKKRLKRIASLILGIAFVVIFFAGCGAKADKDSPYIGTWPAFAMSAEGMTVSFDRNNPEGVAINILEDGNIELKLGKDTQTGKWKEVENGIEISSGKDKGTGTLEDGVLTLDIEGSKIHFHKQDAEATAKEKEIVDGATMNMNVNKLLELME
ncbi:MAG: hypothetical protein Q4G11_01320 [Gallicola sp.]|nr:hypothetical protein [Gallicola sp.]